MHRTNVEAVSGETVQQPYRLQTVRVAIPQGDALGWYAEPRWGRDPEENKRLVLTLVPRAVKPRNERLSLAGDDDLTPPARHVRYGVRNGGVP